RLTRVTLKAVSEYPLILPPRHLTTWRLVDFVFRKHRLTPRVILEAGGWEVIKRYVASGLGVSIVTGICLTGKESLAVIPFNRYFPKRPYGIVLREGRPLSLSATRFIELIKARANLQRPTPPRRAAAKPASCKEPPGDPDPSATEEGLIRGGHGSPA